MATNPALPAYPAEAGDTDAWGECLQLPVEMAVDLAIPRFTVRQLLQLEPRSVINTRWQKGQDVPLRVNGQLIGWAEFEVTGDQLAVRITRLA
jgi:flagellar motor switch protein FliN/FliY